MVRVLSILFSLMAGGALAAACLLFWQASRIRLPLGGAHERLPAVGPLRMLASRIEARGRLQGRASILIAVGALLQSLAWAFYILISAG